MIFNFGQLTYHEIRDRAAASWAVIIPTGCTEQQGPHLPVDFDTWFVETVSTAAAKYAYEHWGIRPLVMPALPFGPTPEHRNYGSGYVDLPEPLHNAILSALLQSLAEQGFRRMIIWRGCGGHKLAEPVAQFNQIQQGKATAHLPDLPYHAIWCRVGDPAVDSGHADSFATSLALYLRPEAVRTELISNPHSRAVDWADPNLDFTHYSSTGVIGDPTQARAELGERLWREVVAAVAHILRQICQEVG